MCPQDRQRARNDLGHIIQGSLASWVPGQDAAQKLPLPAANLDDASEAREIEGIHDGFEKTTGHFRPRRAGEVADGLTGEIIPVQIFVSVLGASSLTYVFCPRRLALWCAVVASCVFIEGTRATATSLAARRAGGA